MGNRLNLEYVTCSWCGFMKYCTLKDNKWICRSCDLIRKAKEVGND